MTNAEYQMGLGKALSSGPEIAKQLKISNCIEVLKALHSVGKISDEEFSDGICKIGKDALGCIKGGRD